MIKVSGTFKKEFEVELDIETLNSDKISMDESDDLIKDAIYEKYNIAPVNEVFVIGWEATK